MTSSAWLALLASFAFLALLVWALWRLLFPAPGRPMVCATCGHHGPTRANTQGSLAIELVLWLALLLPGRAPAAAPRQVGRLLHSDKPAACGLFHVRSLLQKN
jgi:hypothetical protein